MHIYLFIFKGGATAIVKADTLPMAYDKVLSDSNLKQTQLVAIHVLD